MERSRLGIALLWLAMGVASGAAPENGLADAPWFSPAPRKATFSRQSVWNNGIGSGFHKGTVEAGFVVGAGPGAKVFGAKRTHDLALVSRELGWVFSGVAGKGKWWQGNFELLGEFFSGMQFHPNNRYFVGVTPLLRYNLAWDSRWVPFIDLGAGVSMTNIGEPDLSSKFQFNVQGGAGVRYFFRDDMAITALYRFLHFSNAGIEAPNSGTNTHTLRVGLSWFF